MSKNSSRPFQKVREFMKRHAMLDQASGVVIAVSGGADSVALLDILARLRDVSAKQSGAKELNLHVAHLNHLLRGKESDADAEFVLKLSESLAIAATIEAVDVGAVATAKGKGIEETARESRYRFLLTVATEEGCNRIATGHTMSDQAETFVMRLARGAGVRGLASMRPVVPAHRFADDVESLPAAPCLPPAEALLIRPLLCLTRDEVETYCDERGLQFRTDASNESLNYTRNRVRHQTMKALREINPKVVERIAQTAEIIACEHDALEYLASLFLEQATLSSAGWDVQNSEWRSRKAYSIEMLRKQPTGLRRRMIVEAIRRARRQGGANIPQTSEIEFVHIKAVEKLLTGSSSGHRVMLPRGLEVWREFDALVFVFSAKKDRPGGAKPLEHRERKSTEEPLYEASLSQEQASVEVAGFKITLLRGQPDSKWQEIFAQARVEKARAGVNWKIVVLDDSLLPEKLLLRPRRKGEIVQVFGQRKNNKLKKLMIDHKIASSRREVWPIVVTPDGEYVWSPGLPPALKFAANGKTQTLAILCASDVCFSKGVEKTDAQESSMENNIQIVRSQDEIQKRINSLTEEIRSLTQNEELTVVGTLDDSFVFFADLIRALNMPVNCCFLKVTRHEHAEHTDILYVSEFEPRDKNILLVGGVVATGVTLDYIVRHLEADGVKSLRTCMLVDKPSDRRVEITPDFAAFQHDEGYVFGYGLGIKNQHRHLPYLAVMK